MVNESASGRPGYTSILPLLVFGSRVDDGVHCRDDRADGSDRHSCSGVPNHRDVFKDRTLLIRLLSLHLIVLVREHRRLVARVRQAPAAPLPSWQSPWWGHQPLSLGLPVSVQRYRNQGVLQRQTATGSIRIRCCVLDEAVVGNAPATHSLHIQSPPTGLLRHISPCTTAKKRCPQLCCQGQPGWPSLGSHPAAATSRG